MGLDEIRCDTDSAVLSIHRAAHAGQVRWDSHHVVFLGDVSTHVLRRWFQHGRFVVELHDQAPQPTPFCEI